MTDVPLTNRFSTHAKQDPKRIALFVGSDITALMIANKVIANARESGYTPIVYFPIHYPSFKPEARLPVARNFTFYERHLLNNVVIPYMSERQPRIPLSKNDSICYTPDHLRIVYPDLQIEPVPSVNAPGFVEQIKNDNRMMGGISIRCYQIFKEPMIEAFASKRPGMHPFDESGGYLINAHPGPLPELRGIYGPCYAHAEGYRKYEWTLHIIDKDIDRGPIITSRRKAINPEKPVINLYTDFVNEASNMISDSIAIYEDKGRFPTLTPQGYRHVPPRSYPTQKQYDEWEKLNPPMNYIDPASMGEFYKNAFIRLGSPEYRYFDSLIHTAIQYWETHGQAVTYADIRSGVGVGMYPRSAVPPSL